MGSHEFTWVHVSRELPEYGITVLVRYADGTMDLAEYVTVIERGAMWLTQDGRLRPTKLVTHWSYIPDLTSARDTFIQALFGAIRDDGRRITQARVSPAFHSQLMDEYAVLKRRMQQNPAAFGIKPEEVGRLMESDTILGVTVVADPTVAGIVFDREG